MKYILLSIVILVFGGCSAAKVNVSTMPDTVIDTSENSLVFLSKNMYDIPLKYELKKVGFDLKKLPRINSVAVSEGTKQKIDKETSVIKNVTRSQPQFTTRYGIELEIGAASDWCIGAPASYVPAFLEVNDLKTNETIMIIQAQGWTADCGLSKGDLFPKIAKELRLEWNKHKKSK